MEANNKEEVIEQLRYLQSLYIQEYENLLNEITNYNLVYNATQRNIDVLENLGMLESSNILLNLEGGTYIEAKLNKVDKALVYVGSGYLIEKSIDEAKAFLKQNKQKGEELIKELNKRKEEIEKNLIDVAFELEKIGNSNV